MVVTGPKWFILYGDVYPSPRIETSPEETSHPTPSLWRCESKVRRSRELLANKRAESRVQTVPAVPFHLTLSLADKND